MSLASVEDPRPILGRHLTLEEWAAMDEDEPGELVDGRLEEEEVSSAVHEIVVMWLGRVLGNWLGEQGWILGSDAKYAVGHDRGRKPDITVYLPGRNQKIPRNGALSTPPDIAVEVVSSTPRDERRDRIEKMAEYASFGIRFYWILDPRLQSLEVWELTDGRYARAAYATEGTMMNVPGCEGFSIDLDALWRKLSELAPEQD
jgi:Uma2 family endonuclease